MAAPHGSVESKIQWLDVHVLASFDSSSTEKHLRQKLTENNAIYIQTVRQYRWPITTPG